MGRLKLKLSALLKYSKKLKPVEDDLEEYVDFSWKFATKQVTKHESLTAALATLPAYDVVDTWMSSLDLNPCDQSQCQCDCDQVADDSQYAAVESQLSFIQSY